MKKRVTVKSSILSILIVAFLLLLAIGRLFYVSLSKSVDGINLKEFAANRNTKTKALHAGRGTIYDNSGDALALSVNSYKIIAYLSESRTTDINNPNHVVDKKLTAEKLSPILEISEEKIMEYLSKEAYQVEFGSKGKNLTEITKKQIDDLELPGIDFIESTQRYYKMGNFASYLIGYAKVMDDGNIKGELGLESYFNDDLSGKDGYIKYQSDAYGFRLPNVPYITEEAVNGSDLHLTIDSSIQLIAENALYNLDQAYDFDWALMSVMDAKTGAIVASATNPSFNPNDLNTLGDYLNPLVSYTYEPGSTMKIFSWASAIEEGVYNGNATYNSGSIKVADFTISDFNKTGWGTITYDKGFAMSSNVAATLLSRKIGREKLMEHYKKFGFGQKTGIELAGEVNGTVKFKYETEVATAAFGQGTVTVTPIQMLQALTSITNDGVMLRPYVVEKIVNEKGKTTYNGTKNEIGRVMSSETSAKMRELMYNANYDGISKMWQPQSVKMLAKTGTAQIPSPKGGYLDGQYDTIYSVAGIFPDDNPRYVIYVAVKRIIGSQRAVADMTTKAVDEIASYANITEEVSTGYEEKIVTLDNYRSKKTEDINALLSTKGLTPVILGSGTYVTNQYPDKNTKVVSGSKVFIVTNKSDYKLPDFKGWSLSEVKNYAKLSGIKIAHSGYGYVKSQSIAPGKEVKYNENINIVLE